MDAKVLLSVLFFSGAIVKPQGRGLSCNPRKNFHFPGSTREKFFLRSLQLLVRSIGDVEDALIEDHR